MKSYLSAGAAALALLVAGCGEGDSGNSQSGASSSRSGNAAAAPATAPNGDWTQLVTETPQGGYVMGNPAAPVKLVEYGSLTCGHCAEFSEQASEPLKANYVKTGKVSWEFRPFALFPTDPGISMLLRCQGAGPFFRLTDQVYAQQSQWMAKLQALPPAQLEQMQTMPAQERSAMLVRAAGLDQFFRQRGMPEAKVNACLADPQGLQRVIEITQLGTSEGVQGTPTFFINGQIVELAPGQIWPQLEPRLKSAGGG